MEAHCQLILTKGGEVGASGGEQSSYLQYKGNGKSELARSAETPILVANRTWALSPHTYVQGDQRPVKKGKVK